MSVRHQSSQLFSTKPSLKLEVQVFNASTHKSEIGVSLSSRPAGLQRKFQGSQYSYVEKPGLKKTFPSLLGLFTLACLSCLIVLFLPITWTQLCSY